MKKEEELLLVNRWEHLFEKGGFLYGLKGHINPDIAKAYECCVTKECCKDEKEKPIKVGDFK